MAFNVGNLIATMGLDAKGFTAGLKQVERKVNEAKGKIKSLTNSLANLKVGFVASGFAAVQFGKGLINSTRSTVSMIREMQSLTRRMEVVTGSSALASDSWKMLRFEADRLGIGLQTLALNYSDLQAASLGAGMSQKDLEELFISTSQKAAVLGLSTDAVNRTFYALSDMASAAYINMVDLKKQLANAMPGAMASMAKALDVTVPKLKELVATGELAAKDVLPLLAKQFRKETAGDVEGLGKGLRTALARLNTEWFQMKMLLSDGLIANGIKAIVNAMTKGLAGVNWFIGALKEVRQKFDNYHAWFESVGKDTIEETGDVIEDAAKKASESLEEVGQTLEKWQKQVVGSFGGALGEISSFISGLATGADVSFSGMIKNMTVKLLDLSTTLLLIRPMLEWFSQWLKGLGGVSGGFAGTMLSAFGMPKETKAFAEGGLITEPVIGIGAESKAGYLIGESGPEAVIPTDKMESSESPTQVNVSISAVDSKSLTELMKNNPQAIIGPIIRAIKTGDRGLSSSLRTAVG